MAIDTQLAYLFSFDVFIVYIISYNSQNEKHLFYDIATSKQTKVELIPYTLDSCTGANLRLLKIKP